MTLLTEKLAGTWTADKAHSEVGFVVRHAGISKVKGQFDDFDITVHHDGASVGVNAIITADSFNSRNTDRDTHIRSADFLDVEHYPTLGFTGSIEDDNHNPQLVGNLTIHGVTKEVTFNVEFGGVATDPFGNTRAGVEATTVINRKDFGLKWNATLDTGGVLVSDKVTITLELSFIRA